MADLDMTGERSQPRLTLAFLAQSASASGNNGAMESVFFLLVFVFPSVS